MQEYQDYFLGFAGVVIVAAVYAGSYAMWRSQYPVQRVEMCDANQWYVELPDGAMATLYRPAIEVEQELICCSTTIRLGKNE